MQQFVSAKVIPQFSPPQFFLRFRDLAVSSKLCAVGDANEVVLDAVQGYQSEVDAAHEELVKAISDMRLRLEQLSKRHDAAVQKLVAVTSKLEITTQLLNTEREVTQTMLLHRQLDATPVDQSVNSSSGSIDDDELFGGTAVPLSVVLQEAVRSPDRPVERSIVHRIASTMRIHELANDVMWSRRQLGLYVRLIAENPVALLCHAQLLDKFAEEFRREFATAMDSVYDEKARLLVSFARQETAREL
jgi:hypothetical protein